MCVHSYAFFPSFFFLSLCLSGLKVEEKHRGVHRGWDFNAVSVFLFDERAWVVGFDVRFRARNTRTGGKNGCRMVMGEVYRWTKV